MIAVLGTQLSAVVRRPARLLLTGLAILVVSFVVYATVLAQQITERSLLNGLSDTPAAVDLVVGGGPITTAQLTKIHQLAGVVETVGRTEVDAKVGTESFGIVADPGSGPLTLVHVLSGAYPNAADQIAVTPRTSERMGLTLGSSVKAVTRYGANGEPAAPTTLKVVAVVQVPADFGYTAYAPQASVTRLSGANQLSQIDIRLQPGADLTAVRTKITALVDSGDPRPTVRAGADVRFDEAKAKTSDLDQVFAVVAMFVAIAVVAAGLVATSTFRIVFAQRLRQLALLRAVGAGRRSIAASLAVEGALTGLVTGLTGVLLAAIVGQLAPFLLRASGIDVSSPGVPLLPALGTILLAVVITMVAVLAPALSAARVSPLEALRGAGTSAARRDIGVLRWLVGLGLLAGAGALAGYVGTQLPGRNPTNYHALPMLLSIVGSGAFAFFALIALGPVLVGPVLIALGPLIRWFGPVGRLATAAVGATPRRAAAVSVVVALGVTLITGVLVGGASMRVLADRESAISAPADYEVTPKSSDATISVATADQVRATPAVTHVAGYRRLDVRIGERDLTANDLHLSALPQLDKLDTSSGSIQDLGPGKVIISGLAAQVTGLQVGQTTEVVSGKHTVRLIVIAALPDAAPLQSALVLDPADLSKLGAAPGYSGLLLDAAAGGEQGRTAGLSALAAINGPGRPGYHISVLADQRDEINSILDTVLVIALALIGLTVLIAVVGVGTTTALSVVERARESGLLRALGLSRGGLRALLTCESALYGTIGAVLGLALGVPYAWLAVKALGVNAPLTLPAGQLGVAFAALVLLSALAGVLPARRAGTVSPVAALGID